MPDKIPFIKDCIHQFFIEAKLSKTEQTYLQDLIPNMGKTMELDEHLELFNEVGSYYTGEFARLIKQYLLVNNLLDKDNARILKEELILFKNFFLFLIKRINEENLKPANLKRLEYVVLKIDKYLKKYSLYLSL